MLALATAFRVFFLLSALLAAVCIPAWTLVATQNRTLSSSLGGMGWHAHEMIFGYTGAVLAGFLLTATRAWTSLPTLRGAPLGFLVMLWGLGRYAVLRDSTTAATASLLLDGSFYLMLAIAIGIPIARSRSRRNYAFPFLIGVIGLCDVALHLHVRGVAPAQTVRATDVAIDALVLIMIIFGGRIVPLFTKGRTDAKVRDSDLRDTAGVWCMVLYAFLHAVIPEHSMTHASAILVGTITCLRLYGWGATRTARQPILWVLHMSWLLIGVAVLLQGLTGLTGFVAKGSFLHLLTIGGIGLMTFGMMARVSLGHTGRELKVPTFIGLGFALIVIAALARVAAPMVSVLHYSQLLWIASGAWSLAFVAFLLHYAPILLSPRPDGKEG